MDVRAYGMLAESCHRDTWFRGLFLSEQSESSGVVISRSRRPGGRTS